MAFSSWIRNWKRSIERRWALYQTIRRKNAARGLAKRPRLEALEDRWLLSTYTVTNTNNSGTGSLNDAITQANNTASGITEIDFNIGAKGVNSGVQTISPDNTSYMPELTANGVKINGYSENVWQGVTSTSPLIELNGSGVTFFGVDGLQVGGTGNVVQGLFITNWFASIEVDGNNNTVGGTTAGQGNVLSGNTNGYGVLAAGSGNLFEGNYVGTDETGKTADPNFYGFNVTGSNNTIGGTASGAGNVISGNSQIGVWINTSGLIMEGNYVGLNAAGTGAIGNGVGISVTVSGNVINSGNVISGNGDGIDIHSGGVTVEGNYIGTNAAGTGAVANNIGINVMASAVIIGGAGSGQGNVISGNSTDGIAINSSGVTVEGGNYIGTDATGANPLGNGSDGILISASNNTVGAGNTIAYNSNTGVEVSTGAGNTITQNSIFANGGSNIGPGIIVDSGANNNVAAPTISSVSLTGYTLTVKGSFTAATANVPYVLEFFGNTTSDPEGKAYIGSLTVTPTSTGTQNFTYTTTTTVPRIYPLITTTLTDNSKDTSAFSNAMSSTTIYVVTSAADDGKAGELRDAINQANNTTSGITTIDFAIGTSGSAQTINLTSALPALTGSDVFINGLSQGGLGNTTQLITLDGTSAGSSSDGVLLKGSSDVVSGLVIQHFNNGVEVAGASNTVGGNATGEGDVISSNTTDGVLIDSGVSGVAVQGNFIGTNTAGSAALANSVGVEVAGNNSTIGGTTSGVRNVISGNTTDGVLLDSTASGVSVQGNYIGTDVTGTKAVANGTFGINVEGSKNTIGGSIAGAGNVISSNTSDGVLIGSAASGVAVQGNYIGTDFTGVNPLGNSGNGVNIAGNNNTVGAGNIISANSKNGVEVSSGAGNTITQNSIFANTGLGISVASGANNNIAVPAISSVSLTGYTLTIKGSFTAATANVPYVLEFFGNTSSDPEGKAYIGSLTVTPTSTGTQNFTYTTTTTVPRIYPLITATLTDHSGNTSAFSNGVSSGTIYVVTSAADDGKAGELRDAINQANTTSGAITIDFAIGTSGSAQTINLTSALPALTANNVFIDGLSQGGLGNTTPLITLDGTSAGSSSNGLVLQGSNGVVSGLIVADFNDGIEVAGANNTIGGTAAGEGNVISGNTTDGVLIDTGASGAAVQGNFIGTDVTGTSIVANSVGIEVAGSNNTIGGTTSGARNLISGNTADGVLTDSSATGNQVLGNFIGTNVNGTSPAPILNFPNGFASSGSFFTYNNGAKLNGSNLELTDGGGSEARSIFTTNKVDITHFITHWTQQMQKPNADGMTFCIQTDGNSVVGGGGGSLGYQGLGKSVAIKFDLYNNSGEGINSTGMYTDGAAPTVPAIDLTPTGINLHSGDVMNMTATYDGTTLTVTENDPTAKATATQVYTINIAKTVGSNTAFIGFTGGTGGATFTGLISSWTYTTQQSIGNGVGISVGGSDTTIGGTTTGAGNVISGNTSGGLQISGSGVTVQGNYIGADVSGATAAPNSMGILVSGNNAIIGGTTTSARNVISGNSGDGVDIASGASGALVLGNYIGTNSAGTAALGNLNGIEVAGNSNTLGASYAVAPNLISGNSGDGVLIDKGASGNQVLGSFIGTTPTGTAALGNKVGIEDAGTNNTIGGSTGGARNVISGNTGDGVLIDSTGAAETMQNNFIGTDVSGDTALANGGNGVEIMGTGNTIGGTNVRNYIGGNSKDGVLIDSGAIAAPVQSALSTSTTGGSIAAGTYYYVVTALTATGETTVSNEQSITTTGSTSSVTVKWATVTNATGYKIYRSTTSGVYTSPALITTIGSGSTVTYTDTAASPSAGAPPSVNSTGATGNLVQGNFIGVGVGGTKGVGNLTNGIEIAGSSNTIGGSVSGVGNVVSGNAGDGVLNDSTGASNVIQGNFVGTDYSGRNALGNSGSGVEIAGTGATVSAFNVLSGNSKDGLRIDSTGSGTLVQGNYIGVNLGGAALGNSGNGLNIASNSNTVGGTASGTRNIISGNTGDGVLIASGASGNTVLGNFLGVAPSGTTGVGNSIGIEIAGNSNTVGGSASGAYNIISGNSGDGVKIDSGASGNAVLGDVIGANVFDTAALGNSGNGIEVAGKSNTIGASYAVAPNVISGNSGDGVLLDSTSSGNQVLGNYIGVNAAVTVAMGNKIGIEDAGTSNTIGGSVLGSRNIISANSGDGVLIDATGTAETVQDNFIGINLSGNTALANSGNGVEIKGNGNLIGGNSGTNYYFRNWISGNTGDGVLIDNGATGNQVLGNFLGLGLNGAARVSNVNGIEIAGSSNTIGGGFFGPGNYISGNSNDGVLIDSTGANNLLEDNFAGTDSTGQHSLANGVNGMEIQGTGNTVGGVNYARNLISGNAGDGMLIGSAASGNLVLGNNMGSNVYDTAPLGNSGNGIEVAGTNNTIGASYAVAPNEMSGNSKDGVLLDSTSSGNQVLGNYIGTDHSGLRAVANQVGIEDAGSSNTIGGSVLGARNVISGNTGDGVLIDSTAKGETMLQNYIGVNVGGNVAIANSGNGVEIKGNSNVIGGNSGSSAFVRNYIDGNGKDGVLIDSGASGNQLLGNFIGVGVGGTNGVGNLSNGVEIAGSSNTIGSSISGYTNVISGNSNDGVLIDSTGASNLLQHDFVGTDYAGKNPLGNSGNGIEIAGSKNVVGGSASGAGNVISANSKNGVLVSAGSGDTISQNSIFGNAGLGISLAVGANNNIVAPTLSTATLSGSTLTVTGSFTAATANVPYVLEFFANPSGDAEGKVYLGSLTVTPTTTGPQTFTFSTTTSVTGTYPLITATLTDNTGDTSEFSNGVTVA